MKCPTCPTVNLVMTERQGVEIDYCPECRGVWLDRGELDKIIERSLSQEAPQSARPTNIPPPPPQQRFDQSGHGHPSGHGGHSSDHDRGHHDGHGQYPHRKKSFLQDLFD